MKEIEMDSSHTAESSLTVFQSAKYQSSVRMEVVGCFDFYLRVCEASIGVNLKFNEHTLLCLRDVLNRWYQNKIVNRGLPK